MMKQKIITFATGFVIYGIMGFLINYFMDSNRNAVASVKIGFFFGILMGLFEVFINPKIRSYFANRNKKI